MSVRTDPSVSDEALLARAKDQVVLIPFSLNLFQVLLNTLTFKFQLLINTDKKPAASKTAVPPPPPVRPQPGESGTIYVPSVTATGDSRVYVGPAQASKDLHQEGED